MIAVVFMAGDVCNDGSDRTPSSCGQAVQIFRSRGGREKGTDQPALLELVLIGLYETSVDQFGEVAFFDVREPPPKRGRPQRMLSLQQAIGLIVETYDQRNKPRFIWADAAPWPLELPPSDDGSGEE